jgi:TonB family protein
MKLRRSIFTVTILTVLLITIFAHAQQPAVVQTPFGSIQNPRASSDPQDLGAVAVRLQELARQARNAGAQAVLDQQYLVSPGQRGANVANGTAWWTNAALVQRLGLTEDQKLKIERAYENHRQDIVTNSRNLEREESKLSTLLEAENVDKAAVQSQIDRIIQARGEVERANSAMTLEMREYLTRAQWMQLQAPSRVRVGANVMANNLIGQTAPAITDAARQAGITQGSVVLEADISREGIVENLRVITGPPQLVTSAVDAVKQWRYKPMMLNNEAVPVVTTINVNFPFVAGDRGGGPVPGVGQRRGGGRGPAPQ